ncbi:rRNA maturation RNase YbeY [Pseudohalioglobus sediminis]|uniref:Endoribonuclease YbeY n=1 Tax=Pseudohalioglobus sediminis TaxID=2606449 RepID=A0A5B0WSS2_9GAMM|nr:rRNA maturation RNase YbeY [Pseudohalioglobus sediminis]KAA1189973.1 rRNA maturation RNase YbeY [Pseudohalioglobus sediminis]
MTLQLDIQRASSETTPDDEQLLNWIGAALSACHQAAPAEGGDAGPEISLRLVDRTEMSALNQQYRGKQGPTNVLSFPVDFPADLHIPLLGDIIICAPVVRDEARAQGKPLHAHWAHMAIHGTLHLLGYDHIEAEEAKAMEALETEILGTLGIPCPYLDAHNKEHARA